jgi:very-short-patch-repair endonuclease
VLPPNDVENVKEGPGAAIRRMSSMKTSEEKIDSLPGREGMLKLIDYVRSLAVLNDKPFWSLASYRNLVLHEKDLRGRIGIRHELTDEDGVIYLRIDRLERIDPPEAPELIREWLTVGRDPFKNPAIETLRAVSLPAAEADRLVAAGSVNPEDVSKSLRPRPAGEWRDVILRLDRHPEVKTAIEAYFRDEWMPWAIQERPRRETIEIYDRLFSLQQTLKLEGSEKPLEVVCGMGIARWKLPPNELDHPIIERLVELELEVDGAIVIRPRSADPILALKPFIAAEIPGADLVMKYARDYFETLPSDEEVSPFEKKSYTPILRYACAQLDAAGVYHPDHVAPDDRSVPPVGPYLVITDTWAIYARARSENFFIGDLERLHKAVSSAESLPPSAQCLVLPPSDELAYQPGAGFGMPGPTEGDGGPPAPEALGLARLFFPKPFNEEQVAIADQLENPRVEGVVVQGPPGTGKTHTIANIICHYLATGRRVLVTSKSEGALAVLRDQIPEGIRDLAISLLTSEREGLKQLEITVNMLASMISSLDTRAVERDIRDGEFRISELERRIEAIDVEIRSFADKHMHRVGGADGKDGQLPIDLARRVVRDQDKYVWFSDRPGQSQEPLFTAADIASARSARKELGPDLVYLAAVVPSVADLPDSSSLAATHRELAGARLIERKRAPDAPVLSDTETDALKRAEGLLRAVTAIAEVHEHCARSPWLDRLHREWRRNGFDAGSTRPLAQLVATLKPHVERRPAIAAYGVELPHDAHADEDLVQAIRRAAAGNRPFGILSIGKSASRAVFDGIRVLGQPPQGPEAWAKVVEVVSWQAALAGACARWRALACEYGLPEIPEKPVEMALELEGLLGHVDLVAMSVRAHAPLVELEAEKLFPYGLDKGAILSDATAARWAAEAVQTELTKRRFAANQIRLDATLGILNGCSGAISQQMQGFLRESVGNPDLPVAQVISAWTQLLAELERVRALRSRLDRVKEVASIVGNSGASLWAEKLRTVVVTGIEDPWTPDDWREAWNWARDEAHLRSIDGRERLLELADRRRAADEELKRCFQEVVKAHTMNALKARITRQVDAALQMFLAAIRRIGRGTGKGASRLRRDARDAMEKSYAAVPCWIMPTWRVSESLPATLESFDIVIFDEASQSDISALPALLRGKKVLVVGDDKQVSPLAIGIEERQLRFLRMHYLQGQYFAALMLPGNSLYDLAQACYSGRRIMLKEHFRCVEPIIRFSFQFYNDQIVPVRVPKASERLSPPLIDVYVPQGLKDRSNRNLAEAEAIVGEVERIVRDPSMAGRTVGIISLIGAKQAQLIQSLLLPRIGEEAYIRHDIACGDSATFQGKERDIVLLSMVECPRTKTAKTVMSMQQRFNVAMSRARDRLYVFHSVTEEMLKPEDLKAKVLAHMRRPMAEGSSKDADLMDRCDSDFEREVLRRLLGFGYRAQPQVKVGPYAIDLVVEGHDDRRLAIELDGDAYHGPERWSEDLARQRVMERVGWRFWRCWGSSFLLDPDACMDDLIHTLRSLGIEPIGRSEAPTVWTEFRSTGEDIPPTAATAAAAVSPMVWRSAAEPESLLPPAVLPRRIVAAPPVPEDSPEVVAIGDRVQVQIGNEARIRVVTLTADRHDPDLGVVSSQHVAGKALLGAAEDEEIAFEVDGREVRWMVVKIQKPESTAEVRGV